MTFMMFACTRHSKRLSAKSRLVFFQAFLYAVIPISQRQLWFVSSTSSLHLSTAQLVSALAFFSLRDPKFAIGRSK